MDKEKRKFYRHPINVPIRIHPHDRSIIHSESLDISLGGLCFICDEKLRTHESISLTIPVKDRLFEINAKVVYARQDKSSGRFKVGICFSDTPNALKAKLAEESLEIIEYQKSMSKLLGRDVNEEEAAREWIKKYADKFPNFIG